MSVEDAGFSPFFAEAFPISRRRFTPFLAEVFHISRRSFPHFTQKFFPFLAEVFPISRRNFPHFSQKMCRVPIVSQTVNVYTPKLKLEDLFCMVLVKILHLGHQLYLLKSSCRILLNVRWRFLHFIADSFTYILRLMIKGVNYAVLVNI